MIPCKDGNKSLLDFEWILSKEGVTHRQVFQTNDSKFLVQKSFPLPKSLSSLKVNKSPEKCQGYLMTFFPLFGNKLSGVWYKIDRKKEKKRKRGNSWKVNTDR